MIRRVQGCKAVLVLVMFLSLGLAAPTAFAQTTSTNPIDVVRAFTDAYNRGDMAAMRALVAPGTRFVSDPGTPYASDQSFEEFVAEGMAGVRVNITSATQPAPDTVVAEITLTGDALPPLPNPYTFTVTFKVVNGQITSFVQVLSEQTLADLEALGPPPEAQPGMPRSGINSSSAALLSAFGLAMLCLVTGALFRRFYTSSR